MRGFVSDRVREVEKMSHTVEPDDLELRRLEAERKRDRALRKIEALDRQLQEDGSEGSEDNAEERSAEAAIGERPAEEATAERLAEDEIIDVEIVENLPAVIEDSHLWNDPPEKRQFPPEAPPSPRRDAELAGNPGRRCTSHRTNGNPCRRWAVKGTNVCPHHGARAPQVLNKARYRIEAASNKLMGKLIEVAFDDSKPAAVQLDAIKDALNRAGMKPPTTVEIGPTKPFEEIFEGIAESTTRAESRRARGLEPDAIDLDSSDRESISANYSPTHPAPAERTTCADTDYDRSDSTQAHRRGYRDESHQRNWQNAAQHVTGDDAMTVATATNRAIGALPPPRELPSRRW